jgi:hypothetical protein
MKRQKKKNLPVLMALLLTAALAAASLALAGCKQPADPDTETPNGGNGKNGPGQPQGPGEPGVETPDPAKYDVFYPYDNQAALPGGKTWEDYVTWVYTEDTAATIDTVGVCHKEGTEKQVKKDKGNNEVSEVTGVTRKYAAGKPALAHLRVDNITIEKGKRIDANGNIVPLTLPDMGGPAYTDYFPKDVNLVQGNPGSIIAGHNGTGYGGSAGSGIHGILDYSEATHVIADFLPQLSAQAAGLQAFFEGGESIHSKFTDLAAAESQIRRGTASGQKPNVDSFLGNMDTQLGIIIAKVSDGLVPADKDTLDAYIDAYQKYHYLITRDWRTEQSGSPELETARTAYLTARAGLPAESQVDMFNNTYDNGRGTNIAGIGGKSSNVGGYFVVEMKPLIVGALGLDGFTGAEAMAEALLLQIQDAEELRAFKEDMIKEAVYNNGLENINTNCLLEYDEIVDPLPTPPLLNPPVAQIAPERVPGTEFA